ncbi:hypothetical protein tb265_28360 [Gemmatimonadetes bacterium T265]|nr:hypothetical protein tb265_28360 [Gemmatimonadetes bacterium T265]
MADSRPRSELLDRVLSASAAVVALSALAVSVYQAKITREQQKMSAWPYVRTMKTNAPRYARIVQNLELGPALVRSTVVAVDGRPTRHWNDVVHALVGDSALKVLAAAGCNGWTNSTVGRRSVLLPGATVHMVSFPEGSASRAIEDAWGQHTVVVKVCYCSLYGDCWTATDAAPEPEAVRACAVDDGRGFLD